MAPGQLRRRVSRYRFGFVSPGRHQLPGGGFFEFSGGAVPENEGNPIRLRVHPL